MKKEFVLYEQALALKELGFDEPCLAFWDGKNTDAFHFNVMRDASSDYTPFKKHNSLKWFGAPLYQQAFRFFRDNYKLEPEILSDMMGYACYIVDRDKPLKTSLKPSNLFETYEEAELACLIKLIEIIKNNYADIVP